MAGWSSCTVVFVACADSNLALTVLAECFAMLAQTAPEAEGRSFALALLMACTIEAAGGGKRACSQQTLGAATAPRDGTSPLVCVSLVSLSPMSSAPSFLTTLLERMPQVQL